MSWHAVRTCQFPLLDMGIITLSAAVEHLFLTRCFTRCACSQVMMPKKAADARALQKATLAGVVYDKVPSQHLQASAAFYSSLR